VVLGLAALDLLPGVRAHKHGTKCGALALRVQSNMSRLGCKAQGDRAKSCLPTNARRSGQTYTAHHRWLWGGTRSGLVQKL